VSFAASPTGAASPPYAGPSLEAPVTDEDLPVISFVEDVPGLPGLASCVLVALDDDASVFALRSVVDPDLRLLVVAPGAFFPDYSTEVADEIVHLLELDPGDLPLVLLVVNPGSGLADATANLAAPILVNPRTRRAVQALQADGDLSLRAPLLSPAH
jgi:flagellar assembly factor FliW